jgi:hypothetical protein
LDSKGNKRNGPWDAMNIVKRHRYVKEKKAYRVWRE